MRWRSIDEAHDPAGEAPRVLRGVPALEPRAYARRASAPAIGSLVRGLRGTIAWGVSLAAHLAAFALLVGFVVFAMEDADNVLSVGLSRLDGGRPESPVIEAPPAAAPQPEVAPQPNPEPVEAPPDPQPEPEPPAPPAADPTPVNSASDPQPAEIGTGASSAGAPAPAPAGPSIDDDPTAALVARRAADLETLRRGRKKDVVVVTGSYDRVQEVLDALGVPHTVITQQDLPGYDLRECVALLVNCDATHERSASLGTFDAKQHAQNLASIEARIAGLEKQLDAAVRRKDRRREAQLEDALVGARQSLEAMRARGAWEEKRAGLTDKLRTFVAGGGRLFTSDWGLTLLSRSFPDAVKAGSSIGPRTVRVAAGRGCDGDALLREVFAAKAGSGTTTASVPLRWVVDDESYSILPQSAKLRTLLTSPDLARSAIAVTFAHDGRRVLAEDEEGAPRAGRVLHVLSHFATQEDRHGDYGLQNLLVNFLLSRPTGR